MFVEIRYLLVSVTYWYVLIPKRRALTRMEAIRQYTTAMQAVRQEEDKAKQDELIEARDRVRAVIKLVELETKDQERVQQVDGKYGDNGAHE